MPSGMIMVRKAEKIHFALNPHSSLIMLFIFEVVVVLVFHVFTYIHSRDIEGAILTNLGHPDFVVRARS